MFHARPHLQTHTRAEGHSAVAGAAYRLGLKLYDRTNKQIYDFTHRLPGDEVVFQTTLAPIGAPEWATNPLELWNRVEAAEHRKNAQLARDYRVPLPLGLDDAAVSAMAVEIAQFIVERLQTPVSVGVHRDASVDAFGRVKAQHEQGCHAHLYFPTRAILRDAEADEDARKGGTGMGVKLHFLSKSSTAALFVEDINACWANAANRFAAAAGLPADYDHRSYKRMLVNAKPEPRLGMAATAMERRGTRTVQGDAVQEVRVMTEVFRSAHRVTPDTSTSMPPSPPPPAAAPGASTSASTAASFFAFADELLAHAPLGGAAAPAAAPAPATFSASLSERFRQHYGAGREEGDRPEATVVFRLVVAIERAIMRLRRVSLRLAPLTQALAEAKTAHLDAQAELSEWQAHQRALLEAARAQVSLWQRMTQGASAWLDPKEPIVFRRETPTDEDVALRLSTQVEAQARVVGDLKAEQMPIRKEGREAGRVLRKAVAQLHAAHEEALPQLLAVALPLEREWIEQYWPELLYGADHDPDGDGKQGAGRFPPPKLTPRPPKAHR
jgi:hypothetical protein